MRVRVLAVILLVAAVNAASARPFSSVVIAREPEPTAIKPVARLGLSVAVRRQAAGSDSKIRIWNAQTSALETQCPACRDYSVGIIGGSGSIQRKDT